MPRKAIVITLTKIGIDSETIEKGIEQEKVEIAKNMKNFGNDYGYISTITGLSLEDIEKLWLIITFLFIYWTILINVWLLCAWKKKKTGSSFSKLKVK